VLPWSLGVAVVVFQPCANRPPQGDFLSVMKRNLDNLKIAFAQP
jgi:zinc transport system substrate-binding protein